MYKNSGGMRSDNYGGMYNGCMDKPGMVYNWGMMNNWSNNSCFNNRNNWSMDSNNWGWMGDY